MVVLVRSYDVWLALSVLCVSPWAQATGSSLPPGSGPAASLPPSSLPRYLRTALDDAPSPLAPREPRRIRSSLDDPSRASFPLAPEGRLIRVSLDDDGASYGHLSPLPARSRRVRTGLD